MNIDEEIEKLHDQLDPEFRRILEENLEDCRRGEEASDQIFSASLKHYTDDRMNQYEREEMIQTIDEAVRRSR